MEFWRDCSSMSLMVSSPSLARSLPDFELQAVTSFTSHQLKSCKMLHISDCLYTECTDPHGSSQPYMPLMSTHQEHVLLCKASSLGILTACWLPWELCAPTPALFRTCDGEPRIYKGHCKCPNIYQESLRRNKSYMEERKTNLGEAEAASELLANGMPWTWYLRQLRTKLLWIMGQELCCHYINVSSTAQQRPHA